MSIFSKLFSGSPKKQPTHVDDTNFDDEVLKSDVPVLVDVWNDGCAPCKQLEPIMMSLAGEYDGRVKVCELHIRTGMKVAQRYQVRGTPTVLYFRDGRLVERVVGFRGSLYHREIIDNELLPSA